MLLPQIESSFPRWKLFMDLCEKQMAGMTQAYSRLARFKDIHSGRRGFIIGNGPSLKDSDLDMLTEEITFAANKIYLLFDQTSFRPTYYAAVDLIFLENFHTTVAELDTVKFVPKWADRWLQPTAANFFFQERGLPKDEGFDPTFSYDICQGIYGGYTVSFTSIQIAFFMGIRELYLLGMDHTYEVPKNRGCHPLYGEVLLCEGEINHFAPNYRVAGEPWSIPRPDYQEEAFSLAREVFRSHGGRIVNVTRGGQLEVFPRLSLEEVLQ